MPPASPRLPGRVPLPLLMGVWLAVTACQRTCPMGFELDEGGRCVQFDCTTTISYTEPGGVRPCSPDCDEEQTCCDAQCVDLSTDTDHCGSCDQTCGYEELCADGNCVAAASGCELSDCSCQYFYYSCASATYTSVYDYDSFGRISGVTVTYTNDHQVSCSYDYGSDGACTASCNDDDGASC